MCGIAGILNFNQQPVALSQVKAMTDAIAHRGPDGEGQLTQGNIGLGHRRLAIIDLSDAGHQPMQTQDEKFTITYNGEVYNYQEIRTELESLGHQFHSRTDSEVVLNAFVEWGPKCLDKFNGMFAFAIWDKQSKKLFLARDRYGIKPLYYYHDQHNFVFASEIKAIIASGCYQNALDKDGLVEYLTFQNFFTDKTLFKDVRVLKPGYYLEVTQDGKSRFTQYWDFYFQESLKISEEEAVEELDRLFRQAVKRQLVSDVYVNSYLSGGIDSGAVTTIASRSIPHMRSFTVGFDLSSASGLELVFDERDQAEQISYLAKTEHYEMVLKAGDMERCMIKLVHHLEEPRVGQSYPNYYAAKLASKFGKVVLSGIGGDELFAGYPWRYLNSNVPLSFDQFIDAYYLKWQRLLPNSQLNALLAPIRNEIKHVWTRDIFAEVYKNWFPKTKSRADFLNSSLYLEAKTFLHGLLIVEDKLSMAHSLETRVPFLDNDLVDFAQSIPTNLKIEGVSKNVANVNENRTDQKRLARLSGKTILRKTLSRYLPDKIVNSKKQGFSAPDASWFKGESIDYVKDTLLDQRKTMPFFHQETFQNILREHFEGKKNHRLTIWSFLYLHHHLQQMKDSVVAKAA